MNLKNLLFCAACLLTSGTFTAEATKEVTPGKLTPLVGKHVVINQVNDALIKVAGSSSSGLGNLIDTNLDNYVSLNGVAGVEAVYTEVLGVKDLQNTYAAGVPAGFMMQNNGSDGVSLLTADVLKLFVVETFLDGKLQESTVQKTQTSSLLNLNLISINDQNQTKLSVATTKEYNEVRLSIGGISADVLKSTKIYYAFVGESKITPITKDHYANPSVYADPTYGVSNEWTVSGWNHAIQRNNMVGSGKEKEGVIIELLSGIFSKPRITIDAGEDIPANTEVGYYMESGDVLDLNIGKVITISTYDANDNLLESRQFSSVLGLALVGGGKSTLSFVTKQPCRKIKIDFGAFDIKLGATVVYYAFARDMSVEVNDEVELGIDSDVTLGGVFTSWKLHGIDGVHWSLLSQPTGASALVEDGYVKNIYVPGTYEMEANYVSPTDGQTITQNFAINYVEPTEVGKSCNNPIVGDGVTTFHPDGMEGFLLGVDGGFSGTSGNVTDTNLNNYVETKGSLKLIENQVIFGVRNTKKVYEASEAEPRRVGFVLQASSDLLTANLLDFVAIDLYKDGVKVQSSLADENNALNAKLIAGKDNQVRYSIEAVHDFDAVVLRKAGLLELNLSKLRIYYAFEEPADDTCADYLTSESCLDYLSYKTGASIDYDITGFSGVASVGGSMTDLANIIDKSEQDEASKEKYAYINSTALVGGKMTLGVKTGEVYPMGTNAGFVVEEAKWLADINLIRGIKIYTMLNGKATGDEVTSPEVLSLNLIGESGKSLMMVTTTKPYDEVVLEISGVASVLQELKVYGAVTRPDFDMDGTPDCVDSTPYGNIDVQSDDDPIDEDDEQPGWYTGIEEVALDRGVTMTVDGDCALITSESPIESITCFMADGTETNVEVAPESPCSVPLAEGVNIIAVKTAAGARTFKAVGNAE